MSIPFSNQKPSPLSVNLLSILLNVCLQSIHQHLMMLTIPYVLDVNLHSVMFPNLHLQIFLALQCVFHIVVAVFKPLKPLSTTSFG